jgi:hypothetical protein
MEYRYDGSPEKRRELQRMIDQGARIFCDTCGSELIVALDKETANKHRVHAGIYCPKDRKHVMILSD